MADQIIKFGTDGWRGVIGADFTFANLQRVAPVAARVLANTYGSGSRLIVVGYDRRFLAEEFAQAAAQAVTDAGFDVALAETFCPTPALSWIAHAQAALGALVITASHNPGRYLGLKVKGAFGGSVPASVTEAIEQELTLPTPPPAINPGVIIPLDPWESGYCQALREKVHLELIRAKILQGELTVFVDVMHGAAAGGLGRLLEAPVQELHSNRDPLFGGGAPEPLPTYLGEVCAHLRQGGPGLRLGLVFDGDGDRVAAIDEEGNFMSSQILVPILIEHLVVRRHLRGEIVKTVSGSDLIPALAKHYDLPLWETPVGYKYIAERMQAVPVLVGGEESGGIGYGGHIPERDALLSALYLLEAVVESGRNLGSLYRQVQRQVGIVSVYDRVDLSLPTMEVQEQLLKVLAQQSLREIAGHAVISCQTTDGYKFRLEGGGWFMIRPSGTEPLLRLYSEAYSPVELREILAWAESWAKTAGK